MSMTDALEDHEGTVSIGGRKKKIPTSALLVTLLAQQERKKNCQIELSVLTKPQQPMT